jgi:hypothetical protein
MIHHWRALAIACSIGFMLAPVEANAQNYALRWSAFDLGYMTPSTGNSRVTSVVGQSPIGLMKTGNTVLAAGFLVDTLFRGSVTGAKEMNQVPGSYALSQNYPNPFNPSTNIRIELPQAGHAILKVYSVLGQEVVTLLDDNKPAGSYTFLFDARALASGVYFYRLQIGSFVDTKKLLLLR